MEDDPRFANLGWNAKPRLLLEALDRGHIRVMWIDAEIVVSRDPREAVPEAESVLVATQEYALGQQPGSAARTAAWGLEPGRDLPYTVNTGVVVVAECHRRLLRRWQDLVDAMITPTPSGRRRQSARYTWDSRLRSE